MDKSGHIQIKRVYEEPARSDGYRILVDRLWPRGLTKERAQLDEWNKSLAPSQELRTWFGHRSDRLELFAQRYRVELQQQEAELQRLREMAVNHVVTLLYAAKSTEINHARVLLEVITEVTTQKADG